MAKDQVEQIKNLTDIVAVIGEQVSLTKKGRSYWGLCPFHNEKTASFNVDPERQMYKCFGCGAGGDVISFVMEVKGLSFQEALQELGEKAGIEVQHRPRAETSLRRQMLDANRLACAFYQRMLDSPGGQPARRYLEGRGLDRATIEAFSLGYAPDSWSALGDELRRQGIPLSLACKAGLVAERDSGGHYDRFRGRVIFPIFDLTGEVTGFGARVMGQGEPKYLNTPESPLFEKRKTLFNLQRAKETIRSRGAFVVEGYMDVISLDRCGFQPVVATLGTALSEDHVRLLSRFTDSITLVFDGDAAGQKAMLRAVEPFLATEVIPRVAILPAGCDPDDIARQGLEGWNDLMAQAVSIWDFLFNESFSRHNPSKLEDQRAIISELGSIIGEVKDRVVRGLLVERLASRLGIPPDLVLEKPDRKLPQKPDMSPPKGARPRDLFEETLVRLMLLDPEAVRVACALNLTQMIRQPDLAPLAAYLSQKGNRVLSDAGCPEELRRSAARMMADGAFEGDAQKALIDTAAGLLARGIEADMAALQRDIAQAAEQDDREGLKRMMQEKQALIKARRNVHNTVMEVLQTR